MADIRERVAEDRGLLKRIQLHIPGFAGYRRREDLRQADSILRLQVANRLRDVRVRLEGLRGYLVSEYKTENMEKIGNIIFRFQNVEGKIRHAEQGYSGISPAVRIEETELDHLYELDLSLLDGVQNLDRILDDLSAAIKLTVSDAGKKLESLSAGLSVLQTNFERRMTLITGTEVR